MGVDKKKVKRKQKTQRRETELEEKARNK